jgi:hypothetical protein
MTAGMATDIGGYRVVPAPDIRHVGMFHLPPHFIVR